MAIDDGEHLFLGRHAFKDFGAKVGATFQGPSPHCDSRRIDVMDGGVWPMLSYINQKIRESQRQMNGRKGNFSAKLTQLGMSYKNSNCLEGASSARSFQPPSSSEKSPSGS